MRFTELLAQYTLDLKFEDLDSAAVTEAKIFFLDSFGCLLAGINEEPVSIAIRYTEKVGGAPASSLIGKKGQRTDTYNAAIINGIAAHVHDYDDVLQTMDGHPSAVVLPVTLAVAEAAGSSGKDTLLAYILGVQVCFLAGLAVNKNSQYYGKGWHCSGSLGIFGATAAAGRLLGLNKQQLVYAFSMAASESSGLKGNFGTMTKALHVGRAAAKGFYCASMALLGYDANPDIIEMQEGFAYISGSEVDLVAVENFIKSKTSAFLKPGLTMKAWPSCKQNHSAINSIQTLQEKYAFSANDVDRIHCLIQPVIRDCLKYTSPVTTMQGKFSLNYNLALATLYGTAALEHFDGENITDQKAIDFMPKISMEVDMEISDGLYNNGKYDCIVIVYLKDGRVLEEHTVSAKGDAENRMTDKDVYSKFFDCAKRAVKQEAIESIYNNIQTFESVRSTREFVAKIDSAAL